MKKRICTLLLALCLTLGLLPAAAQAAGDGSGTFDTVRWTLDADGGLTVSGTGDLPDGAFAGRTDIVTVTFTGQVARIGRSAFADCTQLRRVDGFGAVTCVMSQAFAGCTALTELPLPDDVAWVARFPPAPAWRPSRSRPACAASARMPSPPARRCGASTCPTA